MKAPRITDTSLRDGSHPMRHQFTIEQVRAVAQALDSRTHRKWNLSPRLDPCASEPGSPFS
jgi:hypothetical protein